MHRVSPPTEMEFRRPPSAAAFMIRAFAPSAGLDANIVPLAATWRNHRVDERQLAAFLSLSRLNADAGLPALYPQVIGFRLNMAVLTHPRFPLPIWNALQSRNGITQRAPLPLEASYTFRTEVSAQRVLEKGVEIDLTTTVSADGGLLWEGTNTFYYRGKHGRSQQPPSEAAAPRAGGAPIAQWRSQASVGWAVARLTGDYNGIHLWDGYARMFGFPSAFHHPQLIIAQCLAHLAPATGPQALNVWIKGPVPYGADLRLDAERRDSETVFALYAKDARPAIIGSRRALEGAGNPA